MDSNFLISDYIKNLDNTENFRNILYKKGIMSKFYESDNLLQVYTKFEDNNSTNQLKNECRSLIIDIEDKKIVSYTCNTPICNLEAMNYMLKHNSSEMKISKCYEGTLMTLFCNKNKWYLSTRRCLDSRESIWNNSSHYDLFMEVLKEDGYDTLENFTNELNESYCYNFILLHHLNKNIVDYTEEFGDDYKKLCLAIVRKQEDLTEVEFSNLNEVSKIDISGSIFIPQTIPTIENFNSMINNYNNGDIINCSNEGIVIKLKESDVKNTYLKIQTYPYQFNKAIGSEKNIFKGFINLYQNGKLNEYLDNNNNLTSYKKIVNPLNLQESYDTIGVVDSVFKVCTSELYELFKILWNLKTGKHMDKTLYNILPKEYKNILYGIRGIYFKNKSNIFKSDNPKNKFYLQIKDIYQYLKSLDTDTFEQFLRIRKLMYNWVKANNNTTDEHTDKLEKFNKISEKCDKVHFKLTAIFTNKLFPHIMQDDMPELNE